MNEVEVGLFIFYLDANIKYFKSKAKKKSLAIVDLEILLSNVRILEMVKVDFLKLVKKGESL